MNILRSFTETVVTTPTDLFPISFEYDEKYDAVHVFLNDVAVEDLGYTVSQVNAVTLKVEPAIPDGTVRIERETDIDKMKYIFDAGALFIDQNVDADFRQIVHSQQEVRDGFIKLRGEVLPLVNGLQEALKQAQEASQSAQEAAEAAEAAAQFVQSVSDYTVLPFVAGKVYGVNRRVQLDNGYIVKSTIANNVSNPNNAMTGWVFDSELLLESFGATESADATLSIQKAFAYIRSIGGGSITTNLRSITVSDVCIYHDNTIFDFNKCKVEFVGSGKLVGAIYNADKTAFVGAGEAEIYYKAAKLALSKTLMQE
ncbi:tail fiber protein [Acinetobacter phage TCUAN2]|nr:tail fiber protein [Acinetobacter phage TCUAN2]